MTLSDSRRTVYIRISFRAKAYFLAASFDDLFRADSDGTPTVPMVGPAGKPGRHRRLCRRIVASSTLSYQQATSLSGNIGDFTAWI